MASILFVNFAERDDHEEKVEEEEEAGGVREIWRLDKEHKTNYLNKAQPFLRVRWVRKEWKLGKFGIAALLPVYVK